MHRLREMDVTSEGYARALEGCVQIFWTRLVRGGWAARTCASALDAMTEAVHAGISASLLTDVTLAMESDTLDAFAFTCTLDTYDPTSERALARRVLTPPVAGAPSCWLAGSCALDPQIDPRQTSETKSERALAGVARLVRRLNVPREDLSSGSDMGGVCQGRRVIRGCAGWRVRFE